MPRHLAHVRERHHPGLHAGANSRNDPAGRPDREQHAGEQPHMPVGAGRSDRGRLVQATGRLAGAGQAEPTRPHPAAAGVLVGFD